MNSLFGALAAFGFALSAAVHAAALFGVPVQDVIPFVLSLHVGIFIVLIPAIFAMRRATDKGDPFALLRGMPRWTVGIFALLFVYAFTNFFAFTGASAGSPEIRDGQYVLMRKGKVIRTITAQEYVQGRANTLRVFSGHWMFFYAVSAAVLLVRRPTTRA